MSPKIASFSKSWPRHNGHGRGGRGWLGMREKHGKTREKWWKAWENGGNMYEHVLI
jgi:hypothetical protein